MGSIPGSGISPGEGNGYAFQYPYLENDDRGAWRTTVHGVRESDTTERLSTHARLLCLLCKTSIEWSKYCCQQRTNTLAAFKSKMLRCLYKQCYKLNLIYNSKLKDNTAFGQTLVFIFVFCNLFATNILWYFLFLFKHSFFLPLFLFLFVFSLLPLLCDFIYSLLWAIRII